MSVAFDSWLKGGDKMAVEDLSLLSAETCPVPDSESPELDVVLNSLRKKKRNKKKRSELESDDKSCESPSLQSQPVQISDQDTSPPLREKNITITDLGSSQSNVEPSLSKKKKKKKKGCETSGTNDTSPLADSGSPPSNVELSLSAKKKKNKGCETSKTYDTGRGSPSVQPQLVQLSDQQAPQPLTEKIATVTELESHQSNVELSLPQNKNKKKKKKKKNKGCETPETNDKEVEVSEPIEAVQPQLVDVIDKKLEVPQPIEDLSISVKSKKRIGKKSRKDEVCDVSIGASVMDSNMPAVAPCIRPAVEISVEHLVEKPLVGGISTTINSISPNPDADFGCSQETKKKKRKRSHKTDEDKELSVKTMLAEVDPSFQPSLAMVSEQAAQVSQQLNVAAQPLEEGMGRTINSENLVPKADFKCSQETNKIKRKRGHKTSDSKELLVEVVKPEADPSLWLPPNAEPPVEGMSVTMNPEILKPIADVSCSKETKKKRTRGCKTTCGGDTDAEPPVEGRNVVKKKKQKRGDKTTCGGNTDAEPLVEGRSAAMNSESLKPNADISCSLKKKKKKRGRNISDSEELLVEVMKPEADPSLQPLLAMPHVEGVNGCSQDTKKKKRKRGGKDSESKELLVEVMIPEADPSEPLLAIYSEHELEVPPPRDSCSKETKKKNRKRKHKTTESEEPLVEGKTPEADTYLQPILAEKEAEVLQPLNTDAEPLLEGVSTSMKSGTPKPNEDISLSQETKKKNRKRKHKTTESEELLVEGKTPEADASPQLILAEKEPEVLQPLNTDAEPLLAGVTTTMKSGSPKPNEDTSISQETKKKSRKRKHKTTESEELLVEGKTLEADASLQPILAQKEPEVLQPLSTDAGPLLEGVSTAMKPGSPKPNEDISFSPETKKKNRKRKHKTSEIKELLVEILTPEADPSLHPSPAIQEVEVSPLNTDAQPLTEGVHTETSETPKPNAAFGCSQEKKKKNPKRKHKANETTELLVEGTMPDTYPSLSPLSILSEQKVEVALPLINGTEQKETQIDEVPSLSHLSPIADTEVVAISEKGNLLQMTDLSPEISLLKCSQKKLLILDINGLLADIVQMEVSIPSSFKPDKIISRKAVFKRPFCDDFLQFCFDRFNVGVWSSRTKYNVDIFIDFLLGDSKHKLLFCWNQSHCTSTRFKTEENKNKPLVLKELRKLWENLVPGLPWARGEYNESNTLLVDDSPYKALRNPVNTAIFPNSYQFRDSKDSSLGPDGDIRSYLEGLAMAENVQKYVEQNPFGQQPITESNPSWTFYRRVIEEVKPLR